MPQIRFIIGLILSFIEFMVLIECVFSWIPQLRFSYVGELISKFNKPFLLPIRKLLFKYSSGGMMVDLSPVVLFLIINIIRRVFYL